MSISNLALADILTELLKILEEDLIHRKLFHYFQHTNS